MFQSPCIVSVRSGTGIFGSFSPNAILVAELKSHWMDKMVPVIGGVSLSKSVEDFTHAISPAES
jgi:hypothetical protein